MRRARQVHSGLLAALSAAGVLRTGCIGDLENEPAYAAERFLCADEAASDYQARIDECRRDHRAGGTCGGIASLSGRLQGTGLVVDTELTGSTFYAVATASAGAALERLDLVGVAPYFVFTLSLKSIGGALDDAAAAPRTLVFHDGATAVAGELGLRDDKVRGDFRIESNRENIGLPALEGSGSLHVQLQDEDELRAVLDASFESEADRVVMCFHAFETSRRSTTP